VVTRGIVVKFDSERGYGFIRIPGSDGDAFVHISDVAGRVALEPGQKVTCDLEQTPKGVAARNVKPGGKASSPAVLFLILGGILAAGFAALGLRLSISWGWAALAGLNAATFVLFGYDKAIAGGQRLRVPESVLHFLTLLGGTPAAFIAQGMFRHKTRKGSFQRVFWLIVFIQLALAGFWFWCWQSRPTWMPEILRGLFPRR